MNKQGQSMSINTIIVAVLALVVLVVLVMVFTGRIALFDKGVSDEARTELIKMRIGYGSCRPTAAQESAFSTAFNSATSVDAKEREKVAFQSIVERCKGLGVDKAACEREGCLWS